MPEKQGFFIGGWTTNISASWSKYGTRYVNMHVESCNLDQEKDKGDDFRKWTWFAEYKAK